MNSEKKEENQLPELPEGLEIHKLKTLPTEFQASLEGRKNFEIRKNDRGFQLGDYLYIEEYDPVTKRYTGRKLGRYVKYMIQGRYGLPEDICVMEVR